MWRRLAAASVRSEMEYRGSFFMHGIGHFFMALTEIGGIWALFARFGSIRGWSLAEVALLYGMANVSFGIAEWVSRGFDSFEGMVKSGTFDRVLLRPRGTILLVAGSDFAVKRFGRLIQGLMIIGWAAHTLDLGWSGGRVGLLIAAVLGGGCLFAGVFVIQATVCFWTVETLEMMNIVTHGGLEAGEFPLEIYATWFRRLFTWIIPLACLNYLPALAILNRPGGSAMVGWLAPLGEAAFLLLAVRVWHLGVRHYQSTGS